MINWEETFDLSELKQYVRIINRGYDFSLDNLKKNLNINDEDDDIYLFIETEQYEYEFFDKEESKQGLGKFKKKYFMSDLLKIEKKLLHFTSLFSHYKIVLEKDENKKFRQLIHNKLIINNINLLNITNKIAKKLGGKGNYFGLHIRVGDDECLKNNLPIIYIATDSDDPKNLFSKFYNNLPCIFTLFDFTKELDILDHLSSDYDENVGLSNFYIPLIDLLITAHGKIFIGTEGSTFSRMAYEVHNLYNGENAMSSMDGV
ncbi:CigA protein [Rhizophagus clarus]|nr:CigA protein [Rhizophagus clarus]